MKSIKSIKGLFKTITPNEWLDLLFEFSSNKWVFDKGGIKGHCLYHEDSNGSFIFDPESGVGRCLEATCGKIVSDPVEFVADLLECDHTAAIFFLNGRWKLFENSIRIDRVCEYYDYQLLKLQIAEASNRVMMDVIRDDPGYLSYCRGPIGYIRDVMEVPIGCLHDIPIGILAKSEHMLLHIDAKLHALFHRYFEKYSDPIYHCALIYHFHETPSRIGRFRLRLMDDKYGDITYRSDFIYIEDEFNDGIGLFGFGRAAPYLSEGVLVLENESDAIDLIVSQDMGNPDCPVSGAIIATGKANGLGAGFLANLGVENISILPKPDAMSGRKWVLSVLRDLKSCPSIRPEILDWPPDAFDIKGYSKHEFLNLTEWVSSRIERHSKANGSGRKTDICLKWLRYIPDKIDKLDVAGRFGVDAQVVEDFDSRGRLDTFEGVCSHVANALLKYFSPLYYERRGSTIRMKMWSVQRNDAFEVTLDGSRIINQLAFYLGKSVIEWLDGLLGKNSVYLEGIDDMPQIKSYRAKRSNAELIINNAFSGMIKQTKCKSELIKCAQGIHYYDLPEWIKSDKRMFFVNGSHVFAGKFNGGEILWERIQSATDSGVIFDLDSAGRWSHAEKIEDLVKPSDPTSVFKGICSILDAWKFQNHAVTKPYLASYIMSLPIMCAVGAVNISIVTGDKVSGKTSLVNGLLGGKKHRQYNANGISPILESAIISNDSTPAGMYHICDASTLAFILDEIDNDRGSRREKNTKQIMRLLYGIPMSNVPILRAAGDKSGHYQYNLKMPIIMASIDIPQDATFLSRVVVIRTMKSKNMEDIAANIRKRFSQNEISTLRKSITTCLLPFVPLIIEIINGLKPDLYKKSESMSKIDKRFADSVVAPLAVYRLLGLDAIGLYESIIEQYRIVEKKDGRESATKRFKAGNREIEEIMLGFNL